MQIPPERLDQIANRFAELEARMASGTLEGDDFVKASRDYAELEPVAKIASDVKAMREEISGPLNADVIIGVREEEMARVAKVEPLRFGDHMRKSMASPADRAVVHSFWQLSRRLMAMAPAMEK